MKRTLSGMTRRSLIQRFGILGFALTPIARAMGYIAGGSFVDAPRFVMFFVGGSLHPASTNPASISALSGTPIAPLQPHSQDIILFKDMSIHGGSVKSDGYQEEHGAGLLGCVTGDAIHYSKNDSYYAYTDHESIDIAIANHYKTVPRLAGIPISSLHVGAGAHSDADSVGLGQRFISYRNRQAGDTQYGNAIVPVQSPGQVYDTLVQRINTICSSNSNQPNTEVEAQRALLLRKQRLTNLRAADIQQAKIALGLDSEHSRKLDGMLEGWRDVESVTAAQLAALDGGTSGGGGSQACPTTSKPTGDGTNLFNTDTLSPIHDSMTSLIKLAFEWDLTRVVAFTLSGASSGQTAPKRGVTQAHHSLEHSNNVAGLNIMGTYYSEKFANLLAALKGIDDGQGQTALYNSSVIMGMECWSNSSSGHFLTNIPFILAGQGAGKFQTGRIVNASGRSNNDLLLSALHASGNPVSTFGLASLCKGPIV